MTDAFGFMTSCHKARSDAIRKCNDVATLWFILNADLFELSHGLIGHQDILYGGSIWSPTHCHSACRTNVRFSFFTNPKQWASNTTQPCEAQSLRCTLLVNFSLNLEFTLLSEFGVLLSAALFRRVDCLQLFLDISAHRYLNFKTRRLSQSPTDEPCRTAMNIFHHLSTCQTWVSS